MNQFVSQKKKMASKLKYKQQIIKKFFNFAVYSMLQYTFFPIPCKKNEN